MDTIQDRLRAAIKEAGLKPVDVARELDITPQAVNSWFATGAIGKDKLSKLAALTNRSTDWFIQGDTVPKAPNSDYIDVRFYEHAVLSAGHGANNDGHGAPRTVPVPPYDLGKLDVIGRVIASINRYWTGPGGG